jgi:WD40 repeat protein
MTDVILLWVVEGRREARLFGSHSRARGAVDFSREGQILATAGEDGFVRLWDATTGTALRQVGEPGDRLTGVALSPGGRILAASGSDADIRLWELAVILKAGTEP